MEVGYEVFIVRVMDGDVFFNVNILYCLLEGFGGSFFDVFEIDFCFGVI